MITAQCLCDLDTPNLHAPEEARLPPTNSTRERLAVTRTAELNRAGPAMPDKVTKTTAGRLRH